MKLRQELQLPGRPSPERLQQISFSSISPT
jgi:hypothetical protein